MLWFWLCSYVKKQVLLRYTVSDCVSAWFWLSLGYFVDFLMREDLVTHLSESSFVEEGLGMWWFAWASGRRCSWGARASGVGNVTLRMQLSDSRHDPPPFHYWLLQRLLSRVVWCTSELWEAFRGQGKVTSPRVTKHPSVPEASRYPDCGSQTSRRGEICPSASCCYVFRSENCPAIKHFPVRTSHITLQEEKIKSQSNSGLRPKESRCPEETRQETELHRWGSPTNRSWLV